jgi:glutamate-ammonia-ligase adenylyltransferase
MSAHLAEIRKQVAAAFDDVVADADETDVVAPFRSIWESGDLDQLVGLESDQSASSRDDAIAALRALRNGSLYSHMDEHSQERLIDVLAKTLTRLSDDVDGATVLRRILPIYEATCRRSAYLALISENQHALENLIALAKRSERLCSQVAERPILLDELLDARVFEAPLTRQESRQLFERRLAQIDTDDIETSLDAIRQFQAAANFRTAINDTLGHLPLMQVSDRLTDTAERCIEFALKLAWTEMRAKHGSPASVDGDREPGLAVIAYGKLGGLELGYGSDLDLVFVHDPVDVQEHTDGPRPLPNPVFFVRLTQRLINILSIQTPAGRLYEIDTRLRPSGESGQLVTSISSFERYQLEDAWVWEHQALLRSRPVAGPPELCDEFNRIRTSVLTRQVAGEHLRKEISNMRQRMRDNLSQSEAGSFDVKQDPGGLADIEFLVDYLVLSHANAQPDLVTYPDNIRQLDALATHGILEQHTADKLKDCYLRLRRFIHDAALDNRARVVPADQFENEREFITQTWAVVFG